MIFWIYNGQRENESWKFETWFVMINWLFNTDKYFLCELINIAERFSFLFDETTFSFN